MIASFVHATYNTLVGPVPALLGALVPWFRGPMGFVGFVVAYDGLFGLYLYRKLRRYGTAYRRVHVADGTGDGAGGRREVRDPED